MHPYDEAVEWIKSQKQLEEARDWLETAGKDYGVIHELSHEQSLDVVEEAYMRGAKIVEVVGELSDSLIDCSVDMLLLTLPKETEARARLFELEAKVADMTGFEISVDEGQNYILLRWT
ncbi:MAG: hypothetical protein KDA57_18765 [Planctomycetales bacterium]|nr:hypothetical protein [Planctomycetales bacterium]